MKEIEALFPDNLKFMYIILFYPLKWVMWIFEGNSSFEITLKVTFLLLPALFILVANFATIISLVTILFRRNKTHYVATVLITWWDGGKSIFLYWVGILKFLFLSFGWMFGAFKIAIVGSFQTLKDIIFTPVTVLSQMAKNYSQPGVPWIAVSITFFWVTLEAMIFSYVLTPMVSEILVGLTGNELQSGFITVGLFVFLFMIVGGSLACMDGLVKAIEKKEKLTIAKMLLIEFVVMMVEVVFFYREFVESVLPFFNRMSQDDLIIGPFSILLIGATAWFGVRIATWFFFAKYGTPTLLMIISREEMKDSKASSSNGKNNYGLSAPLSWIKTMVGELREEMDWFTEKGHEIKEAFILPPVQVMAVMTNFMMILLTQKNLFNLPIEKVSDIKDTKAMLDQVIAQQES